MVLYLWLSPNYDVQAVHVTQVNKINGKITVNTQDEKL